MEVSSELVLGTKATEVAEDIERQMAAQKLFIQQLDCWEQVRIAAAGATLFDVPDHVPAPLRHSAYSSIVALAIHRIWNSSKVVYAVHPQMLEELADSSSEQLPGPIFDLLPHTNPLVTFPEPIPTTTPDGARGRVLGFYVYGSSGNPRQLCSSHDDGRDSLGLMFVTALVDDKGKRVDTDLVRVTVPVGEDTFTVEEAVERTLARFGTEPGMFLPSDRMKAWLIELIRAALNVLLYLSSEEPDTITVRPARRRGVGKGVKPPKPTRMIKVGWRLGPAFHAARRAGADHAAAVTETGRRRPVPHQRRGHFRTYWTGHGRTTPVLRFIKPFMVNLDLVDETRQLPLERRVIAVEPRSAD